MLTIDDFDFELPPELIAQIPAQERSGSRLLHVEGERLSDFSFGDLPALLAPDDLLVFNDTRVIRARFAGIKETGGVVEVMLERITDGRHAIAQVRASKSPKPGSRMILANTFTVRVTGRSDSFFALELEDDGDFWEKAESFGALPLPPYIEHAAEAFDEARYQTVYASVPGAVAAPTAGLHFDETMLENLSNLGVRQAFVTLHVGAGTYQPVRVRNIEEHQMHSECYCVPEETACAIRETRARGGRVIAVGTTSLRTLESAALPGGKVRAGEGETEIFITPGYRFQVVDRLITNFHLPKSTLLMLVSAFSGMENIRAAYTHAIAQKYRFFSYGDGMLLEKQHAI